MKIPEPPDAARSFSRLGITTCAFGGAVAFFLSGHRIDPDYARYFRLTLLLTIILAGLCFIIASAKWFMKR